MPKNYPGRIRQRGDTFQVLLTVGGKRHRFTVSGEQDDAEEFARTKYDQLRKRQGGSGHGMRVSDLLDAYAQSEVPKKVPNSRTSYLISLAAIAEYFTEHEGNPRLDYLRPLHVQRFVDWRSTHRRKRGKKYGSTWVLGTVSPRTTAKDRTMLHMVCAWAEKLDLMDSNPVPKVDPPRLDPREPVILSDAEFERLLDACDRELRPHLWLYALLLGETGLRCESEALWLRWDAIDLERGFLTVQGARKGRRTKSGKARVVPLTPRLREAIRDHAADYRLQTYKDVGRSPWVLHHDVKRRHAKAGARVTSFRRGFANAAERAELPADLHQHDLRHRRVTKWLAEGKSPVLVQKAMGHSDLRVTLGYTHLVPEDLLQLVEDAPKAQRVS